MSYHRPLDTVPIIDAIGGEGGVVDLRFHQAHNPVFVACRCGIPCAVWYTDFTEAYSIRHGDGEALRDFSWSQVIAMTPIRDWIDAVHEHERPSPFVRADFIVSPPG